MEISRKYIRTDRNGTQHFEVIEKCWKCGGTGYIPYYMGIYNGVCFECNGSGTLNKKVKEYTPEYRAKLDAKNEKKLEAANEARKEKAIIENVEFMKHNFFDDGMKSVAVIKGNTYDIKDTLAAENCKFHAGLNWYAAESERECFYVDIDRLIEKDDFGKLHWKGYSELAELMKNLNRINYTEIHEESKYQGTIGEKLTLNNLTIESAISFERKKYTYGIETAYVNKMSDEQNNVYVWIATNRLSGKVNLTGTVKEHKVYNDIKQTILKNCRVKEI